METKTASSLTINEIVTTDRTQKHYKHNQQTASHQYMYQNTPYTARCTLTTEHITIDRIQTHPTYTTTQHINPKDCTIHDG